MSRAHGGMAYHAGVKAHLIVSSTLAVTLAVIWLVSYRLVRQNEPKRYWEPKPTGVRKALNRYGAN